MNDRAIDSPRPDRHSESLASLRLTVLNYMLLAIVVLAGITTIAAIYESVDDSQYGLAITYSVLYGLLVCAAFFKKLGFGVRASLFLLVLLSVGISEIYVFGLASMITTYLFAFVVFTGILFGLRRGLYSLAIGLTVFLLGAWYYLSGTAPIVYAHHQVSLSALNWWPPILTYMFLAPLALISSTLLLRRLSHSMEESRSLLQDLEDEVEQRRATEDSLRESEGRYRLLAERGSEIIWEADLNRACTYITPSVEAILGWTPDEIVGKSIFETVTPPSFTPYAQDQFDRLVSGKSEAANQESELVRKDGSLVWCEILAIAVRGQDGKVRAVQGVIRDVARRKILEERLIHSQKLAALGELAGGVAHDFNNLLTAIMGSAYLLAPSSERSAEEAEAVDIILECSRRASELTSQLLDFARKGKIVTIPLDLHEIIRKAERILAHTFDRRITLCMDLKAGSSIVVGDPTQLENAVINLCLNARDAMPGGGEIRLSTEDTTYDEAVRIGSQNLPPGQYIVLTVSDTGQGIDEEVRSKIFDPFFTTKPIGKGTGLGLPSVLGCVESHNGAIEVKSTTGEGTTFTVTLPVQKIPLRPQPTPAPSDGDEPTASAHILLVDDDEFVLKSSGKLLEHLGYSVTTYDNPSDALDYYETDHEGVDLVIFDMNMPGMSSLDLLRALKTIAPAVPALLYTGYTDESSEHEAGRLAVDGIIRKPVRKEDLAQAIATALQA